MGATYYVKNLILDYIWGKQTYTVPNTVYVGLCTACNDNGTVTGEPTIGTYGYARVAVTNNDITTTWGAAASGIKRNSNGTIQFPQVTTASWGTLTYWFISDAALSARMRLGWTYQDSIQETIRILEKYNSKKITDRPVTYISQNTDGTWNIQDDSGMMYFGIQDGGTST